VEYGDDIDDVTFEAIDQAIRVNDEFTQVVVIVLGHGAPRAGMADQVFGATRELISRLPGIQRCVAGDVLVDTVEMGLRLGGPSR
jgi:hypothetical protein